MKRRRFLKNIGLASGGVLFANQPTFALLDVSFPVVRTAVYNRKFKSQVIEEAIREFSAKVRNTELAWLFNNCFPNTLDTTVTYSEKSGIPDTYIITGDIDAMWLRDSTAQVWPYLSFLTRDNNLKKMIHGLINRQTRYILSDPYANAFYDDSTRRGEWRDDLTDMKPGIHERKWEIDSLCYPIRLAYHYWKETEDITPFNDKWLASVKLIFKTFKEQQRKKDDGPYHFQRKTSWATDGVPMNGYGYPTKPIGLICSAFRPSDDATIFPFLIPSNFFAVTSLNQASEMIQAIHKDNVLANSLTAMANEIGRALEKHAIIDHDEYGKVYAYEINGFGSYSLMDDANIPSLLAMPYLDAIEVDDEIYKNTRKMILSDANPFFYKGRVAEGVGGPHIGKDMIWPLSIIARGLTSVDDNEIRDCIKTLQSTHGKTGFMHESFHKDDSTKFTRSWFAWANTIFGEFLWKIYQTKPYLMS